MSEESLKEHTAVGCERIFSEEASGKTDLAHPKWERWLSALRDGDSLVVVELSRLVPARGSMS